MGTYSQEDTWVASTKLARSMARCQMPSLIAYQALADVGIGYFITLKALAS